MKSLCFRLALGFFLGLLPAVSFCQSAPEEAAAVQRKFGLSANIQNSEFGLTIPVFISQRFVIAPAIGLNHAEEVGRDLVLGLMAKFYFSNGNFMPYGGLRAAAIMRTNLQPNQNSENKTETDYLAGIAGGAEYFLIPNFSFGVEGQLNLSSSGAASNRFGNPGNMNINLATAVTANIYFTRK